MGEVQTPEYIPESERGVFSQLSPESQKVLLSHYQSITNVMNGQETGQNQVTENTGETLMFGLTLAEKQSIEADINAGKPIMATPAYSKFLAAFLPNGLKTEDEKGLIFFSSDAPEYEIINGTIRANHAGAVSIIAKGLSELFGRVVRLPTSTEVQDKILEHSHYAGYRNSHYGKSLNVDDVGYGWVDGDMGSEHAPYAGRHRYGSAYSVASYRRSGFSLFPYFG